MRRYTPRPGLVFLFFLQPDLRAFAVPWGMSLPLPLAPRTRRILQACLYETIAIALVAPLMTWLFDQPPLSALALTVTMSAIALGWNYGFNTVFERWEAQQIVKGRSLRRRLAHGVGFEVGLAVMLIPVMALWLTITLLEAFLADAGIMLFFFVYTMGFTWAFDRVFGLPQSALADG